MLTYTTHTPQRRHWHKRANDPYNLGAKLEIDVYNRLLEIDCIDALYHENELIRNFGWDCASVDTLIVIGEYIVPIQLKYRNSKRRETQGVVNFMKSIQSLKKKMGKKVLFGVWSSRMMPFQDNLCYMKSENIEPVVYFESIEGLVNETVSFVNQMLANLSK